MGGEMTEKELREMPRQQLRESARPCGCDPGANHKCEYHQRVSDQMQRETSFEIGANGRVQQPADRVASPVGTDLQLPGGQHRVEYISPELHKLREPWTPPRYGTGRPVLPTDPKARKAYPIMTGLLRYFPDACAEVAHVSYVANEQHNPGQPMHWDRSKSMDQEDTELRHMLESAVGPLGKDSDGLRHRAKAAWRALAALQLEIEEERDRQRQDTEAA